MENIKFSDMNISDDIKKALVDKGYEEATAIQTMTIDPILKGLDVLGLAQTGTGKTCAFAIPIIERTDVEDNTIQTLILCPTRELVLQTCEEITSLLKYKANVRVASIYGGQLIDKQIFLLKKKPQIIVGTPGRILDHLRRKTIKFNGIRTIVLDEADEMLNMGFREDLDTILGQASEKRQTILFSATMSRDIKTIASTYQKDPFYVEIPHETLTVSAIKQYYVEISEGKKLDLLDRLVSAADTKLALVFCNTKKRVDELMTSMQMRGYSVEALHGDMRQSARDNVLNRFKHGKLQLLIATDVAARGIDVNNIEVVFNYDVPIDDEYYVHRIGRTGRAGKEGMAITFITAREYNKIKYIEHYTKAKIDKYTMPSVDNMIEMKINKILSGATANKVSEYATVVENFLDKSEDLTISDLAYYLIEQQMGDINKEEFDTGGNSARMFINLGKMDQLTMSTLTDFITDSTGVKKTDIQGVEIFDKFSFFNVPLAQSQILLDELSKKTYNNRRVGIEISSGRSSKRSDRGPRRETDGGTGRRDFNRSSSTGRRDFNSSNGTGRRDFNSSNGTGRRDFKPRARSTNAYGPREPRNTGFASKDKPV